MPESEGVAESRRAAGQVVLGVDTCGPSGTVALARIEHGKARILGQKELAGRTYSATLVAAIGDLLAEHRVKLAEVSAIVVVHGPGSFTGVRVGLSAVKGLAEPGRIPVASTSRLAILAAKTGVESAALDAHRHEVYLRLAGPDGGVRELLAGAEDLSHISESRCGAPSSGELVRVAVCDDAAAGMVSAAWSEAELVRSGAPTAADAIELCAPAILAGEFADLELLDGHYLRRSDAEIFGDAPKAAAHETPGFAVRRMLAEDLDGVVEIAERTHPAPGWPRQAYATALDPDSRPRRIALVAENAGTGDLVGFVVAGVTPPEAELESIVTVAAHQRHGVARALFSALKSELRRQEVREVILEVRAGNRAAQGFYRFLGFSEEGRRPAYYSEPTEDAVLMRLSLR